MLLPSYPVELSNIVCNPEKEAVTSSQGTTVCNSTKIFDLSQDNILNNETMLYLVIQYCEVNYGGFKGHL